MGAGVTTWKKKRGAGVVRCFAVHHPGSFKDLGIQELHPCGDKGTGAAWSKKVGDAAIMRHARYHIDVQANLVCVTASESEESVTISTLDCGISSPQLSQPI